MRSPRSVRAAALVFGLALATSLACPRPGRAEIFKWVDDNSIVHYTTNRASVPIKFQDTVKIVETPAAPPLLGGREIPSLPELEPPIAEENLPPPRGGTDVTGSLLRSGGPVTAAPTETRPRTRTASISPLEVKAYVGKGEGWWRAQFYQQRDAVERQQKIVDTHRTRLRQIIKSHAGGEQVLPLEDDPDFQKMADILPREENRLNHLKRNLRRLEARADALRVPEAWHD